MIKLTYNEETETLEFARSDGSTLVKCLNREPDAFRRVLYQYMAELDEGSTADVSDWAVKGSTTMIPLEKVPTDEITSDVTGSVMQEVNQMAIPEEEVDEVINN